MNIHPIIVHFPIALLFVYAIFELLRFRKITAQPFWFYIKALLVTLGTVGALASIWAGEQIEHAFDSTPLKAVVEMHSLWAHTATLVFSVLALAYIIVWSDGIVRQRSKMFEFFSSTWNTLFKSAQFILKTRLSFILALAGLVAIIITGALGASIAHGPNTDPIVSFIYSLFFKN